jgi:hydrogenase maturation protein HypF
MNAGMRFDQVMASAITRYRLTVIGRVQGVGFRPAVHRLATAMGLAGFVRNDGHGVTIEVEGTGAETFAARLTVSLPPLARIERLMQEPVSPLGLSGFAILESARDGTGARLSPDVATCPACLAEMRDPANRRFGHAFIACTDCGPRFSMTRRLPYDRATTTMGVFPLCARCDDEYRDPASRRFHAEPVCCPDCGPRLSHTIAEIVAVLKAGGIVALKGIGGYHLACDATNETAVATLRARKKREAKPFAVMVPDVDMARQLAMVSDDEARLMEGADRPIVLVDRASTFPLPDPPPQAGKGVERAAQTEEFSEQGLPIPSPACGGGSPERSGGRGGGTRRLAPAVAMGLPTLGLFLPSTPLQHVIFDHGAPPALVMTSANISGDPIVIDETEAAAKLAGIADLIVSHDREIRVRADDGVVRLVAGTPTFIRRSRGQAPEPVRLPRALPPVAAVGAFLKTTVAVADGDLATLSAHIGDLDTPAAISAHESALRHLLDLTRIAPRAVAHDLHPDFPSTRLAERLGLPTLAVQHHHAHALAVAAEHGLTGPFLALVLDGVGHGTDGTPWGGELLRVDGLSWQRIGHLKPLPLPGGDRAAREPWRIAAALLARFGRTDEIARRFAGEDQAANLARNIDRLPMTMTTSAGRLFDAAAALCGIATRNRFEAEAAMRLEAAVTAPCVLDHGWSIDGGVLDLDPLMRALTDGSDPQASANLFHGTLAECLMAWARAAAAAQDLSTLVLAGGCFVNRPLTEQILAGAKQAGLRVLAARAVPPGDGGLALGQAFAAGLAVECATI